MTREEIISLIEFKKDFHARSAVDYAKKRLPNLTSGNLSRYTEDCLLLQAITGKTYLNEKFKEKVRNLALGRREDYGW